MAEATHYSLQVLRVRNAGGRVAKLYVEVELRINGTATCRKTRAVNDDGTLDLNNTFSLSFLHPSATLRIGLKESSKGRCFAYAEQEISSLSQGRYENPVKLSLIPTPWLKVLKNSQEHAGTVDVHLKSVDVFDMATYEVSVAKQSIEHLEKRVDRRIYRCDVIGHFIEAAGTVIDVVSKVSGTPPLLGLVQTLTLGLFKLVAGQFEADKELADMVEKMNNMFTFSHNLHKSTLNEKNETLRALLKRLLQDIVRCAKFVQEYAGYNFFERLLHFPFNRKIRDYADGFLEHRRCLDSEIGLDTMQGVSSTNEKLGHMENKVTEFFDKSELLRLLGPDFTANKGDNLSGRRRCLEETRTMYLQEIEQFVSSATKPSVLWLSGVAGSGKSTIALTALDKHSGKLVYQFFEREKSTPSFVIRALAYDLALVHSSVAPYIMSAAKADPNIKDKSLTLQFETLLLKPLLAADSANVLPEGIVFMLDALDECGTVEQRRDLLQLLNADFPKLPNTRCIITSRPEEDIKREFSSSDNINHVPLEHDSQEGRKDVARYIGSEISLRSGGSVTQDIDVAARIQELTDAANGLFIWATTALKVAFAAPNPWKKLRTLQDDIRLNGASGLDGLYATVLEGSEIDWNEPEWKATFASVLGVILVAKEALSCEDIADFLGIEKCEVDRLLGQLRAVLYYETGYSVRLHHASFADYLLSPTRSKGKPWNIGELEQRAAITERCFDVIDAGLRFNICNLETSFVRNKDIADLQERIKQYIPPHLLYACRYWDVHMCELSSDTWSGLLGKLEHFLKCHLLHWFEVLSLTNDYNRVAGRALYDVTLRCLATDRELSSFLWASYKLASAFAYPISQCAPQIYLSAVSLWRFESMVAKHYSTRCPTICVDRIGTKPPARYTQILRGSGVNKSAAFSSDWRRVAACSWVSKGFSKGFRLSVSVWDSDSGMRLSTNSIKVLSNHRDDQRPITSFSHNIKHLAAVNEPFGRAFSIWDVDNGKLVSGPFEGHDGGIGSLAFSPDCKYIASGSRDRTIRIWDVSTGSLVSTLVGHYGRVLSVAFSPDGRYLASGSRDRTIRIWDVHSGKLIGSPSKGHTDIVTSVAFSPNGEYVASGSSDLTVRIWNVVNGVLVSSPLILEGHGYPVNSVAFSPDSSYVASRTIIWDVRTGARVYGPLDADIGSSILSLSFSPDGRRVMSCHSGTICLWDFDSCKIDMVTSKTPLEAHTGSIMSVAFSPDGKYAASGSVDKTIRVWNAVTGEPVLHLKGHRDAVTSVAFSSDGTQIVSGSEDETVRVWSAASGVPALGPFKGHSDAVNAVAFSQDRMRIVSGSSDKTIRVWDATTGEPALGPFKGHTDIVTSVAFSQDGKSIVSGSKDWTIRVWNADNGALILDPLNVARKTYRFPKGHRVKIVAREDASVAFSADGRHVVFVEFSGRTCIWDVDSGAIVSETSLNRLNRYSRVFLVAFSPDRSRVVLCCHLGRRYYVSVFDVNSGSLLDELEGHLEDVQSVAFSPDGRFFVSGSDDCTIRVWKVHRDIDDTEGRSASVSSPYPPSIGETGLGNWNDDGNDSGAVNAESSPRKSLLLNWTLSGDGWVLSERGELLTWIPDDMRATLWRPRNTAVPSQFSTKLDFVASPVGPGWSEGFPLPDS